MAGAITCPTYPSGPASASRLRPTRHVTRRLAPHVPCEYPKEHFRGYSGGDERDTRGAGARVVSDAAGERLMRRDPLADPERLIQTVYAYVAYRVGPGPDAEDITSDVFERAMRYRASYDPNRGEPVAWLIGIARRCVDGAVSNPHRAVEPLEETVAPGDLADEAADRLSIAAAVATLSERDRELIALRYGADLTGRQIGEILDMSRNAVDVAVHRAVERLRQALDSQTASVL
jgi:RNA polymerase sigma-70 factor (ECF subfamily)